MKRKKCFLGRTILAAALLAVFAFAAGTITAYGANEKMQLKYRQQSSRQGK